MTEVSVLQEYCQKNNLSMPKYQYVEHSKQLTTNTFVCRLTCDSFVIDATGNNKKKAKRNAAAILVNKLVKNDSSNISSLITTNNLLTEVSTIDNTVLTAINDSSDVAVSSTNCSNISMSENDTVNSVGKLQELCAAHKFSLPIYQYITTINEGTVVICTICDMVEKSVAPNKRTAKQDAARKMYDRVFKMLQSLDAVSENELFTTSSLGVKKLSQLTLVDTININGNDDNDATNIKRKCNTNLYSKLSKYDTYNDDIYSIPLDEYHSYFKTTLDKNILNDVRQYFQQFKMPDITDVDYVDSFFTKVCTMLNITNTEKVLKTTSRDTCAVAYTIHIKPECTEIGTGPSYNQAKFSALIRCISLLILLTS